VSLPDPLRVALIGAGRRFDWLYLPILAGLCDDLVISGVWSRSEDRARRMGERLAVPSYTDMDRLVAETAPQLAIVAVGYGANGTVGLQAVDHGLNVLLETPIAHRLSEADAIIAGAARQGLKVEVAEQYHYHPNEQIKLALIASGLFGRIHTSFNDFQCHGYHGMSVMRSYLGFDAVPAQVTGTVRSYDLAPAWSPLSERMEARRETQEHGTVEFADGRLGIYHWTDVGYDSPLRWWRSSRFLGERGMGVSAGVGAAPEEWLALLDPDCQAPRMITLERRWEWLAGGVLKSVVAHTGDPDLPTVTWENPLYSRMLASRAQWNDDQLAVALCLWSLVTAVREGSQPAYGAQQARLDQELTLAMRQSSAEGGRPVTLPLDPAAQTL
jgi:predicted dehydrogenase